MWVEFVAGFCLAPRVFLWAFRISSLLKKPTFPNANLIRIEDLCDKQLRAKGLSL